MEYVRLGRSDLKISRVGFGCEQLGGTDWGPVDEASAAAAVRRALDLGVTLFDTADVYGLGRSEEILGRVLGPDRHRVQIATKFGIAWEASPDGGRSRTYRDARPERIGPALEGSLRRLGVDRVSLYQLHWPDPATPLADTLGALVRLREAGKIGEIGLSNVGREELELALTLAPIASVQLPYSLLDRRVEGGMLDLCAGAGVSVIVYGGLAHGLLSGKYGPDSTFPADDRRSRLEAFQGERLIQNLKIVERVKEVAARRGHSASQVALGWLLCRPQVTCVLVGARSPAQVEDVVRGTDVELSADEREWLEAPPH
ncbi:MAG: aldo/keto reductase [Gemmatimonadales bacterium]